MSEKIWEVIEPLIKWHKVKVVIIHDGTNEHVRDAGKLIEEISSRNSVRVDAVELDDLFLKTDEYNVCICVSELKDKQLCHAVLSILSERVDMSFIKTPKAFKALKDSKMVADKMRDTHWRLGNVNYLGNDVMFCLRTSIMMTARHLGW